MTSFECPSCHNTGYTELTYDEVVVDHNQSIIQGVSLGVGFSPVMTTVRTVRKTPCRYCTATPKED